MQHVRVSFWPIDNNAMEGLTLEIQVDGTRGIGDQWARDLADTIAPIVPTAALGWTSPAAVSSITVQDGPRDVSPNEPA